MAINLSKGQRIDITKTNPGLKNLKVGLGWDINAYQGGSDFDLDVSVFMLGDDNKIHNNDDFIFYGNLQHPTGSVIHMGDNTTGEGEGDDEEIRVDLSRVPSYISKISFVATIYDAEERRQNFGQVDNAYIRIVNLATGQELIKYELYEDFSTESALIVGELYRHNGEWKFSAVGSGFNGGLESLCDYYGLEL